MDARSSTPRVAPRAAPREAQSGSRQTMWRAGGGIDGQRAPPLFCDPPPTDAQPRASGRRENSAPSRAVVLLLRGRALRRFRRKAQGGGGADRCGRRAGGAGGLMGKREERARQPAALPASPLSEHRPAKWWECLYLLRFWMSVRRNRTAVLLHRFFIGKLAVYSHRTQPRHLVPFVPYPPLFSGFNEVFSGISEGYTRDL